LLAAIVDRRGRVSVEYASTPAAAVSATGTRRVCPRSLAGAEDGVRHEQHAAAVLLALAALASRKESSSRARAVRSAAASASDVLRRSEQSW